MMRIISRGLFFTFPVFELVFREWRGVPVLVLRLSARFRALPYLIIASYIGVIVWVSLGHHGFSAPTPSVQPLIGTPPPIR